jgi:hypothetical protein
MVAINGFRNHDLRRLLFAEASLLWAHKLIARVSPDPPVSSDETSTGNRDGIDNKS